MSPTVKAHYRDLAGNTIFPEDYVEVRPKTFVYHEGDSGYEVPVNYVKNYRTNDVEVFVTDELVSVGLVKPGIYRRQNDGTFEFWAQLDSEQPAQQAPQFPQPNPAFPMTW